MASPPTKTPLSKSPTYPNVKTRSPLPGFLKNLKGSSASLTNSSPLTSSSSSSFDGESREKTFNEFLEAFPQWKNTEAFFDKMISEEFSRLEDLVYLDYTGSTLYSKTQVEKHRAFLMSGLFGNPHSLHEASQKTLEIEAKARADVLSFFKADPDEYSVIFTPNATGAIKLVAECYPFGKKKPLLITYDNHTSVVGLREYAARNKASFDWVPIDEQTGFAVESELKKKLGVGNPNKDSGLFCFPAQSNWSGVQHNLEHIELAQKNGWDVLMDGAAFAPTNELDLSKWKPDFVPLSFYKIFGYPTGLGCLIAKKKTLLKLEKPWFAGGSTTTASVRSKLHGTFRLDSHHHWEDGTPNFLHLNAVSDGFDWIKSVGMANIHERVVILAEWLHKELKKLTFPNGNPLVTLYGTEDFTCRGGTVTFNVRTSKKKFVPKDIVEQQALTCKICVRGGCFCNPGSSETMIGVLGVTFDVCMSVRSINGNPCPKDVVACAKEQPVGAVRISFGIASRWDDAYKFLAFMIRFLDSEQVKVWKREWKGRKVIPDSLC